MSDNNLQAEYNKRFLDRLKVRRPDLMDKIETETYKGIEYIKIEIPPPSEQEDAIIISTIRRELTMSYHAFHAHFDYLGDSNEQEEFDELFDYINSFMNEELIAVSEFTGKHWSEAFDASPDEIIEPKKNSQMVVRSWKGTYSRIIDPSVA